MALVPAAALVLAAAALPTPSGADELGRLFFTPEQRLEMDRRRDTNSQAATVTASDQITVNGRVTRSSGRSTTWINGTPQNDLPGSRDAGRIGLRGEGESASTQLRVGETLDRTNGEKSDGLGGGTISVQRR
jgi:hypothetical protein